MGEHMTRRHISLAAMLALLAGLLISFSSPAVAGDMDCSDFDTQAQAQNFYDNNGPGDPHGLDADDDGIACETLPCPCSTGGGGGGGGAGGGGNEDEEPATLRQRAKVVKIIDGDTFKARLGKRRVNVRMLGIDTPELRGDECGSRYARRSLKSVIPRGTRVRLISDPTQDRKDRYGRLLRYTHKASNNKDVNRFQVWRGWGKVYVYDNNPFKRTRSYRKAQKDARDNDRGIWGQC